MCKFKVGQVLKVIPPTYELISKPEFNMSHRLGRIGNSSDIKSVELGGEYTVRAVEKIGVTHVPYYRFIETDEGCLEIALIDREDFKPCPFKVEDQVQPVYDEKYRGYNVFMNLYLRQPPTPDDYGITYRVSRVLNSAYVFFKGEGEKERGPILWTDLIAV